MSRCQREEPDSISGGRSKLSGPSYNGSTGDFESLSTGSIPVGSSKFIGEIMLNGSKQNDAAGFEALSELVQLQLARGAKSFNARFATSTI